MRRLAAIVVVTLLVGVFGPAGLIGAPGSGPTPALAATPTAGQSLYVPVDPVRLLDSRDGTGGLAGRLGAGQTHDLLVADGLRVPAGATAVVLNVTATGATGATDVRAYPTPADDAVPTVSNLNVVSGGTVANLVTVRVGQGGRVRLRNTAGAVHLVADLAGYTSTAGGSSFVAAAEPLRLLDTRTARSPLGPGEQRQLDVTRSAGGGSSGVPADATAVVLNVTAVGPTRATDIRVHPLRPGSPPPRVSNLNPAAGSTVANLVAVAVGAQSSVVLRNATGSVHLLADLAGWYVGTDAGAAFHPVAPVRLVDTRAGGARVGPGGVLDVRVAGAGVVPSPATAVVLNVTAVRASGSTDVRVYPLRTGGAVPTVSNLNLVGGQTLPNAVAVAVGRDGTVRLRNSGGTVDLLVDLAGWYAPTGDGWDISWPQCTARGSTVSNLPDGGAFAVVGLTRGSPFTDNECFAAQWRWASSLPGEPAVYVNVDAPGVRDGTGANNQVWAEVCGTGPPTSECAARYGERIAAYALPRLPQAPSGGRPMVWMDVEGPYPGGPFWQQEVATAGAPGIANAVAVNRAVIQGLVDGLRRAGYRVGTYSDRGSVEPRFNDWRSIVGDWRLLQMQNWVFRSPDAEPRTVCGPEHSFSGGPVVMAQVQPATNPGVAYDVDGLCP